MRYVVVRTTDGIRRGEVIEGTDIASIIECINSLFSREFKLVSSNGSKLIVTNGHELVVLKLK